MDKAVLKSRLADVLEIRDDNLTDDFALTADNWDSMAQLGAIAVIDEVCGVVVPTNELKECRAIGDLVKLIERNSSAS